MNTNKLSGDIHKTVVLFDGFCHLCDGSVQFLLSVDSHEKLFFAPIQSKTGETIIQDYPRLKQVDSILLYHEGAVFMKSEALFKITSLLPWYWRWLSVGRFIPTRISDFAYDFIARNRYKILGKRAICRVPSPKESHRFLT